MDISSSFGASPYGSITKTNTDMQVSMPPGRPKPVEGELSGYLSQVQGSDEAKNFMQDFMSMNMSGEFDAEALAESAPDSLKAYAQEQGVDLAEMMQAANDKFQQMGSKMPGGRRTNAADGC